jgi:hypothetical protein
LTQIAIPDSQFLVIFLLKINQFRVFLPFNRIINCRYEEIFRFAEKLFFFQGAHFYTGFCQQTH